MKHSLKDFSIRILKNRVKNSSSARQRLNTFNQRETFVTFWVSYDSLSEEFVSFLKQKSFTVLKSSDNTLTVSVLPYSNTVLLTYYFEPSK